MKENKGYQPDLFEEQAKKVRHEEKDHSPMLCCGHVVPYMHHCPSCGTRND